MNCCFYYSKITAERTGRDRVYDVARRDVARDERDSSMIRHEINDARYRLAERQRLDALRQNDRPKRTEMNLQLSGDRRRMETRNERVVERNIRLGNERTVDASEPMEHHRRRIRTENGQREGERRMEIEREIVEQRQRKERRNSRAQQYHLERNERNSIRRGERADRVEAERIDRRSRFYDERRNEIRESTDERVQGNSRQTERENQESRHVERSESRETERFIRMEARRNEQRREDQNILTHISRQQKTLGADVEMATKESQLLPSGLAWPLLELAILSAIIAHIIKKDNSIKTNQ